MSISVGVDIGHSSVKVVGVALGKKPKLLGCKEVAVDSKYLTPEKFEDPAVIGAAIKEAMAGAAPKALKSAEVHTFISESLVFRKIIELPQVGSAAELESALRLEVSQYLPESIDNVELDWQCLGETTEGASQIMVVAVPKTVIAEYLKVFDSVKLRVKSIDARPSAVARAVVPQNEDQPVVLIDIESMISTVSVYYKRMVWVTSTVNAGSNLVTKQDEEVTDSKKALKQLAANLIEEVDHVVKFYANRTVSKGAVSEIRITGRGALLVGIVEALEAETSAKVSVSASVIQVPPFCDRRFSGAIGAALYPTYEKLS